jgi:hypothetical protein
MSSNHFSDSRVYRPSLRRRLPALLMSAWIMLIGFGAMSRALRPIASTPLNPYSQWLTVGCMGLVALVGLFALVAVNATRLTLSPKGIDYRELLYTLQAQWEDVSGTRQLRYLTRFGDLPSEALVLRHARVQTPKWNRGFMKFMGRDRLIPIQYINDNWRHNELGEYIRQHAPHFERDLVDGLAQRRASGK